MSCTKTPDACVRLAIAEMFVFVDQCAAAYPDARSRLLSALDGWSVLRLRIPRLEEATDRAGTLQTRLRKTLGASFRQAADDDRASECRGRYALLQRVTPQIAADSVDLPDDILSRYRR